VFNLKIDDDDNTMAIISMQQDLKMSARFLVVGEDPVGYIKKMASMEIGKIFNQIKIEIDPSLPPDCCVFVGRGRYEPKIVLLHNVKKEIAMADDKTPRVSDREILTRLQYGIGTTKEEREVLLDLTDARAELELRRQRDKSRDSGDDEIQDEVAGYAIVYNVLRHAAEDLRDACLVADANGELSEHIDGSLLDRVGDLIKKENDNVYKDES
jgi:hypothetical protein